METLPPALLRMAVILGGDANDPDFAAAAAGHQMLVELPGELEDNAT